MRTTAPVKPLLAQARRLLNRCDLESCRSAAACYRQLLADDPQVRGAYAGMAEACAFWGFQAELRGEEHQSRYGMALACAEAALRREPASADAHRAMATALRRGSRADAGRWAEEAQTAVELDTTQAENWYEKWRADGSSLEHESIRRALTLDPELFRAVHDLGVAYCEAGQLPQAETHLRRALTLEPRHPLGSYNLAMVCLRLGQPVQARRALLAALETDPKNPLLAGGLSCLES